ncbi:MAG: YcxB family protein [Bacteroidetes bacterium]|nr:YcxB family protein [Bacteroidota bacterium]
MQIKSNVTFKEYVKLLYKLTYERPVMKLILAFAGIILVWIIFYYLSIFDLPEPLIYQYLTLVLIFIVQPIVIYTTIRRNYFSSNYLMEPLEMEITSHEIKIKGDSFYLEIKWHKIYKIVEKPRWFLLYQNSLSAILIPKNVMSTAEVANFRGILKKIEDDLIIDLKTRKE